MSLESDTSNTEKVVDLSQLQNLSLGPSWGEGKVIEKKPVSERSERETGKSFPRKKRPEGRGPRRPEGRFQEREREPRQQVFLDIKFYPDDGPFSKLIKAIKASYKTYELFEISQLILEKPERLVAVIRPAEKSDVKLYCSVPDGMPFLQEDQALNYVFKNYLEQFFNIEEVEAEAPKGSFPTVNKCGITGELLGPPNYHRYQQLVLQHYRNHLSHMPYEKFTARIESSKDPEVLNTWLEKMKKVKRYITKPAAEGEEPKVFNTWEEARMYLLQAHKNALVKVVNNVRLAGKFFEKMPQGEIKRMIENHLQAQRVFPLETANNLRGRLRRLKFSVYRKGSKGISYVCAVKRKFRDGSQVFAETVQKLVEFLEKQPGIKINELAKSYLNIDLKPENEVAGESNTGMSDSEKAAFNQLMVDLRWLVTEGYVTEYGNGALQVQPVLEVHEKKALEAAEAAEGEVAETADKDNAEIAAETEGESEVISETSVDNADMAIGTSQSNEGSDLDVAK